MKQPISKKINLRELVVNPKNYRFDNPVAGEKEAMRELFEVRGKDKMFNLIKHIMKHGINPTKKISVIKFQDDKYKLLDGNRRVTTLKLINDLTLMEDSYIRDKIKELAKGKSIQNTIECVIFDTKEDAELWIKLEHRSSQDGISTLLWDIDEREKLQSKYPAARQIKAVLMGRDDISEEDRSKIKKYSLTNIERLITNPKVKSHLGLKMKKGQIYNFYEEDKQDKLIKIIKYLIENKITSRNINTSSDQFNIVKKALEYIPEENYEEDEEDGEGDTDNDTTSTNSTGTTGHKPRTKFIPDHFSINISVQKYPKVNKLFKELKMINLRGENWVNMTSFAFRVFIEFSMNCYIEKHDLLKEGDMTAVKGWDLKKKIITVVEHMKQNKKADIAICQEMLNQTKQQNGLFSPDTLNAYMHNHKFSPTSVGLINIWNNIEDFIDKLWENIN